MVLLLYIHVISPYFRGRFIYFVHFLENLPKTVLEFTYNYLFYTFPYLEVQIPFSNSRKTFVQSFSLYEEENLHLESCRQVFSEGGSVVTLRTVFLINEPRHEKINVMVSNQVRQKPGCTATEDG